MLAHFIEASVMFQNSDIYMLYGIIFGALAVLCAVTYYSACNNSED